jgi:hypothetical protein
LTEVWGHGKVVTSKLVDASEWAAARGSGECVGRHPIRVLAFSFLRSSMKQAAVVTRKLLGSAVPNLPDMALQCALMGATRPELRALSTSAAILHGLVAIGVALFMLDRDNFVAAVGLSGTETGKALGLALHSGGLPVLGTALVLLAILAQCCILSAIEDDTLPGV